MSKYNKYHVPNKLLQFNETMLTPLNINFDSLKHYINLLEARVKELEEKVEELEEGE